MTKAINFNAQLKFQTKNKYYVVADLPGCNKDDVQVETDKQEVRISDENSVYFQWVIWLQKVRFTFGLQSPFRDRSWA